MLDVDTCLSIREVPVADVGKNTPLPPRPGKAAALSPSEVITLALFSHWRQFERERALSR